MQTDRNCNPVGLKHAGRSVAAMFPLRNRSATGCIILLQLEIHETPWFPLQVRAGVSAGSTACVCRVERHYRISRTGSVVGKFVLKNVACEIADGVIAAEMYAGHLPDANTIFDVTVIRTSRAVELRSSLTSSRFINADNRDRHLDLPARQNTFIDKRRIAHELGREHPDNKKAHQAMSLSSHAANTRRTLYPSVRAALIRSGVIGS